MILISEDNLLTEQLQAAVNYEKINLRIQDLQRAERYLRAAGEASRRYANNIKMVQQCDSEYDWRCGRAWMLINSKEELLKRAVKNSNRYKAFMDCYKEILLKEVDK